MPTNANDTFPVAKYVSSWTLLFEDWAEDRGVRVHCFLDDGSCATGDLGSFNSDDNEGPDRDLVLAEPLTFRYPGSEVNHPYPASAACISASRIRSFLLPTTRSPLTQIRLKEPRALASLC